MGARQKKYGFTIVELLIVIVVIAIIAAITVTAYNGIQMRAYNSERKSDIAAMIKAVELHYAENGRYPATLGSVGGGTSCLSAPGWNCWGAGTSNRLVGTQYAAQIPQDPQYFDGNAACNYPNPYTARMYGYITDTNGTGYAFGAYLPGYTASEPNYFNGASNVGCLNFANYLIRKNI